MFGWAQGKQGEDPAAKPLPPQLYEDAWRDIDWENNENLMQEVMKYKPDIAEVQHLRVLLYGWVGAGKSSFINSVATTLLGRMAIPAAVNTSEAAESSFTVEFKAHKIRKGQGSAKTYFPCVFNDIMGLEGDKNQGVRTEDIKMAMKGHIKDGYKKLIPHKGNSPSPSESWCSRTDVDSTMLQQRHLRSNSSTTFNSEPFWPSRSTTILPTSVMVYHDFEYFISSFFKICQSFPPPLSLTD